METNENTKKPGRILYFFIIHVNEMVKTDFYGNTVAKNTKVHNMQELF